MSPAIDIQGLSLGFVSQGLISIVLRDVSLRVGAGEIVGLVGESGSGKSSLALALSRLLPDQSVDISGRLTVYGRDVMALRGAELQRWRGSELAVVFQEPMNALNPSLTIGRQLGDVIRIHQRLSSERAREEAMRLLQVLCIEDPARVLACHPNTLSGGMRQRVLIAMALACKPKVLIADEPTTALDVSVQAEVLQILREQAAILGMAVLFISHDLTLVRQFCQRVYVLHRGLVVESGSTDRVLRAPVHPYTRSLLEALPNRHAPRSRIFAPSAAEVVNGGGA
jgi:ABC-type glutathione transport system ATPase component